MNPHRRQFITTTATAAILAPALITESLLAQPTEEKPKIPDKPSNPPSRPVVISSANGIKALQAAMDALKKNADPLDAVIEAVTIVENDPEDTSVGYGGLPNEDGVVELDASVMHGPTHKAGAVASLQKIKNPAQVARLVMQRTDHVLLVGEGALRFAKAHGFKEENLLTEKSRQIWLKWKESISEKDNWLSPEGVDTKAGARGPDALPFTWGTVNCCAVDANGNLAGVTSTSGLSWKLAGRVGDSPIIGAGLYVDNEVGAAGSTGRGEANLQNCSSFLIVELMRSGMAPEAACMATMKRVVDHTEPRLRDNNGRPRFDLKLYALAKGGRHGGASIWSGGKYAVQDIAGPRLIDCAYLYEGKPSR